MSDSIAGVVQHKGKPRTSRSGFFWFILYRLVQRSVFTALLLIGVVFFVALAMQMARGGGYTAFSASLPSALDETLLFFQQAVGGDLRALEELGRSLPKSLGLLGASLILGAFLGIVFGGFAALYRHSRISTMIINFSIIGISTPSYVAAMFLIWTVVWIYQQTGVRILPIYGFGWDLRILMPMLVLATRPMANITRLTYTALKDVYEADYVRTAYGKGLRPRIVFIRHVLKNAGIPILTTAAVSFRFSLSMLPIVESIFSWLGVGYQLIQAAQVGDFQLVITMTLPLVILFALTTILLDFLYPLIDPRVLGANGVG